MRWRLWALLALGIQLAVSSACSPVWSPGSTSDPARSERASPVAGASIALSPTPSVTLTAAYAAASGAMSPLWFAADTGLFTQKGLNVELRYIASGTTLVPALISDEVQVALVGGDPVIRAALGGADLVLVGAPVPVLVFSIYGEPSLTQLTDLVGKRIAVSRYGTSSDYAARQALQRAQLTPGRDVAIIQAGGIPEAMAAVQAGGVEAAALSPPTTLQARAAGLRELLDLGELSIPYLQTAIATGRRQLMERPQAMQQFLRAIVEAMSWARQHPQMAQQIIGRYTHTEDTAILEEAYRAFVLRFPPWPYVPHEAVEASLAEIAQSDERARLADATQFYDNRYMAALEAGR